MIKNLKSVIYRLLKADFNQGKEALRSCRIPAKLQAVKEWHVMSVKNALSLISLGILGTSFQVLPKEQNP